MGTHEYPWILQYPWYGADTGMIFIQRDGHGFHTIRTHGYPLTSLLFPPSFFSFFPNILFPKLFYSY